MRNRHYLLLFITVLLLSALACTALTGAPPAPTAEPTAVATPTIRPTATPDLLATVTAERQTVDPGVATPTLATAGNGSGSSTTPGNSSGGTAVADASPEVGGTASSGNGSGANNGGASNSGGGSPVAAACPGAGQNLLQQPGFEGPYEPYGFVNELNTPPPWAPWYEDDGRINLRPEYKPADGVNFPNRVRSGTSAQVYFKSFGQFMAGLYQQVVGVQPGSRLQFSAYGQAWSCEDFSKCGDATSYNPANMLMRVGIDPYGGRNHLSRRIVWSEYFNPIDRWEVRCVETVAQESVVTVFLWASPDGPRQNQDVYWDDASLVVLP